MPQHAVSLIDRKIALEHTANHAEDTGEQRQHHGAADRLHASKAALNMMTVQLAEELRGTPTVSARLPVEYALLGENAVSGRFVEASGETPW